MVTSAENRESQTERTMYERETARRLAKETHLRHTVCRFASPSLLPRSSTAVRHNKNKISRLLQREHGSISLVTIWPKCSFLSHTRLTSWRCTLKTNIVTGLSFNARLHWSEVKQIPFVFQMYREIALSKPFPKELLNCEAYPVQICRWTQ